MLHGCADHAIILTIGGFVGVANAAGVQNNRVGQAVFTGPSISISLTVSEKESDGNESLIFVLLVQSFQLCGRACARRSVELGGLEDHHIATKITEANAFSMLVGQSEVVGRRANHIASAGGGGITAVDGIITDERMVAGIIGIKSSLRFLDIGIAVTVRVVVGAVGI